jgi:hypothetical protein
MRRFEWQTARAAMAERGFRVIGAPSVDAIACEQHGWA